MPPFTWVGPPACALKSQYQEPLLQVAFALLVPSRELLFEVGKELAPEVEYLASSD